MTKYEAFQRIDKKIISDNKVDALEARVIISEIINECENDIKVITIDIKKQLAIAYMEGGSAMRDYYERIGEVK